MKQKYLSNCFHVRSVKYLRGRKSTYTLDIDSFLQLILYCICFSLRPWDPMNDVIQYENDFIIQTKTRHRTPIVRTTSITNVEEPNRHTVDRARVARIKRASIKHLARTAVVEHESGSSSPDGEAGGLQMLVDSDSSPDDDGA